MPKHKMVSLRHAGMDGRGETMGAMHYEDVLLAFIRKMVGRLLKTTSSFLVMGIMAVRVSGAVFHGHCVCLANATSDVEVSYCSHARIKLRGPSKHRVVNDTPTTFLDMAAWSQQRPLWKLLGVS